MDLRYEHGQQIYVLRACPNDDAADLIAIGGDYSVDVIQITDTSCRSIASFQIGCRITAIAWSMRTVSPSSASEWVLELAAAAADFGLHILTKTSTTSEDIFAFGGGLSGHHGKVNDISFCGGTASDSTRYIGTVSDDKMLMVWDLHPTVDVSSTIVSPVHTPRAGSKDPDRPQPTAYVIAFPYPLTTITSHPSTSKEFLVADSRGSVFLTDWRSDPEDGDQGTWRHSSLIELIEPYTLANSSVGHHSQWSGSLSWRKDSVDIIGGVYGPRFAIWDISSLHGGKPMLTGNSFLEGGNHFRWCQTFPEYFAISTQAPAKGAIIHVHNVNYIHTQPTAFNLDSRPHFVRDFDFLALRGIPRVAAAVGKRVIIFSIGVES
ncbi:hypothetical protein AX16_004201 [Volvariella volvacea WC 439]|nr:hypothetical protein AX16_004201 [Volvariella volvacea WC 439]